MKIKLMIVDNDRIWTKRFISAMNIHYADSIEVYSFSDLASAANNIEQLRTDVLLIDSSFDTEELALPTRCSLAYLVDDSGLDSFRNCVAICRFQKAELIYKQIVSIYSDNAGRDIKLKQDGSSLIYVFSSPCGGCGTSSVAVAFSRFLAGSGKSVLYLNLEKFGTSDVFFQGEGSSNLSDVIYAILSKKSNLQLKLESCVKQDRCGVYFFSQANVALDFLELGSEDIMHLLKELSLLNKFDNIVIDMDFELSEQSLILLKEAAAIVWVSDGSKTANNKVFRAFNSLLLMEKGKDFSISGRINLIYNKFSSTTSSVINNSDIKCIGGINRFDQADELRIVNELSSKTALLSQIVRR